MFCRFGSELLRAAGGGHGLVEAGVHAAGLRVHQQRAARRRRCPSASAGCASRGSGAAARATRASSSSTSTAVDADGLAGLLRSAGRFSFSKRISPSCFGELTLNSLAGQLEDARRSARASSRSSRRDCDGQRRGVHADAGPFDIARARRRAAARSLIGHARQALGFDGGRKRVRQLAREVGAFGGETDAALRAPTSRERDGLGARGPATLPGPTAL